MSNEGWSKEIFDEARGRTKARKKEREKMPVEEPEVPQDEDLEEIVVDVAKNEKEPPVKLSWFSTIFRGWRAAKDAVTVDVTPLPTPPVENPPQRILTGNDVMYIVPADMRKIKVRILESNGRLKNQYTLTDYLSIGPKDKIHILIT